MTWSSTRRRAAGGVREPDPPGAVDRYDTGHQDAPDDLPVPSITPPKARTAGPFPTPGHGYESRADASSIGETGYQRSGPPSRADLLPPAAAITLAHEWIGEYENARNRTL